MSQGFFDYRYGSATDCTVADLSPHLQALVAYEDISDLLSQDAEQRLVDFVKTLTRMSHNSISKRYSAWAEADRAHDLYVPAEATAFRNKVVISDTRAIADTVLTYFMAAITGRNPMFQLEGMNRNSRKAAALLERVLHQQMRSNASEARLAQLFLDSLRYGFAPTKCVWLTRWFVLNLGDLAWKMTSRLQVSCAASRIWNSDSHSTPCWSTSVACSFLTGPV